MIISHPKGHEWKMHHSHDPGGLPDAESLIKQLTTAANELQAYIDGGACASHWQSAPYKAAELWLELLTSLNYTADLADSMERLSTALSLPIFARESVQNTHEQLRIRSGKLDVLRSDVSELSDSGEDLQRIEVELAWLTEEKERLEHLTLLVQNRDSLSAAVDHLRAVLEGASDVVGLEHRCTVYAERVAKLGHNLKGVITAEAEESFEAAERMARELAEIQNRLNEDRMRYQTAKALLKDWLPVNQIYREANEEIAKLIGYPDHEALLRRVDQDLKSLDVALRRAVEANELAKSLHELAGGG